MEGAWDKVTEALKKPKVEYSQKEGAAEEITVEANADQADGDWSDEWDDLVPDGARAMASLGFEVGPSGGGGEDDGSAAQNARRPKRQQDRTPHAAGSIGAKQAGEARIVTDRAVLVNVNLGRLQ